MQATDSSSRKQSRILTHLLSRGQKKIFAGMTMLTRRYEPTTPETIALFPQASEIKPAFHHKLNLRNIYIYIYIFKLES